MSRTIVRAGLIVVTLFCLGAGRGAVAGMTVASFEEAISPADDLKHPSTKNFKLKGGGQIDVTTFTLEFSGKSSPLGKYDAAGTIDPATFQIEGTLTTGKVDCVEVAPKYDSVNWTAAFQPGPLGDFQAIFTFTGGTGKYAGATGSASGPVVLDADFMFTINLEGKITY